MVFKVPICNIHTYDLGAHSIKFFDKVFEGLGIIYLETTWVILFCVNSKGIHQFKQKYLENLKFKKGTYIVTHSFDEYSEKRFCKKVLKT